MYMHGFRTLGRSVETGIQAYRADFGFNQFFFRLNSFRTDEVTHFFHKLGNGAHYCSDCCRHLELFRPLNQLEKRMALCNTHFI